MNNEIFLYLFIISSILFIVLFVYLICDTVKKRREALSLTVNKPDIEFPGGQIVESPIPDAPSINVMFCKGRDEWLTFIGYGYDLDSQTAATFIGCINDAADVLNGKEK